MDQKGKEHILNVRKSKVYFEGCSLYSEDAICKAGVVRDKDEQGGKGQIRERLIHLVQVYCRPL